MNKISIRSNEKAPVPEKTAMHWEGEPTPASARVEQQNSGRQELGDKLGVSFQAGQHMRRGVQPCRLRPVAANRKGARCHQSHFFSDGDGQAREVESLVPRDRRLA